MAYANGYDYRRTITVNATKVGGTLNSFPMLVAGTYAYLATTANGGNVLSSGNDIIFTDTADTLLDYEQVAYNATTGEIEYWVKMPTLYLLMLTWKRLFR